MEVPARAGEAEIEAGRAAVQQALVTLEERAVAMLHGGHH
jgi:hypothetical protein